MYQPILSVLLTYGGRFSPQDSTWGVHQDVVDVMFYIGFFLLAFVGYAYYRQREKRKKQRTRRQQKRIKDPWKMDRKKGGKLNFRKKISDRKK